MTDSTAPRTESVLHQGQFLHLLRVAHWEYVRRPRSSGAGFIVALTDDQQLVLVEQYRYPVDARCIELPAGIIGDSPALAAESAEDSALRELEEETGFRGTQARLLVCAPTAPGMTAELSYFVRVHGLTRLHGGGGVDDEDITTHCVPLSAIDGWLEQQARRGRMIDARIYAALYLLQRENCSTAVKADVEPQTDALRADSHPQ